MLIYFNFHLKNEQKPFSLIKGFPLKNVSPQQIFTEKHFYQQIFLYKTILSRFSVTKTSQGSFSNQVYLQELFEFYTTK